MAALSTGTYERAPAPHPSEQDGRSADSFGVSDRELARSAASGDRDAWDAIFAAAHPAIFRYLRTRTDENDAADIAADVFMVAVASIETYKGDRPLLAWLYGIAKHRLADHHRKFTRRERFIARLPGFGRLVRGDPDDEPKFEPHTTGRDTDPAFAADRLDLDRAMARLTEKQREVLQLRYFAGFQTDEIAAALGRAPAAFYSLEARALARLRDELR